MNQETKDVLELLIKKFKEDSENALNLSNTCPDDELYGKYLLGGAAVGYKSAQRTIEILLEEGELR